ncbi:hypothetical protein CPB84DRAFT_1791916, partial [Gymnopilus junonius]
SCHAFLWKNFVEPSLSNLMYDEDNGCGILTDFDLSLLQWEPRIFGTDRMGTIPFMASLSSQNDIGMAASNVLITMDWNHLSGSSPM